MAKNKTVTLKLSKEDHDLLIPNLDNNLRALRGLWKCAKADKLWKEENAKKEAEEIEAKRGKEENLEKLTEKEKEKLKDEDTFKVETNLMKMQALGMATANIDREFWGDYAFDPGALAMIFQDLYEETRDILVKYGLTH